MFEMNTQLVNPPKISIVTPSYNQGAFIEETIQSIINQNYSNVEHIIIDGGSRDNSVDIIRKYEKHLAYWVSEKDSGQSEAINKGFIKATGDIVCWLNSDDIFLEGALNKVATFFDANKGVGLVNGQTVLIDRSSNILSGHFVLAQKKWYAKRGIYYINQPAMFWRRNILDSIGLLREDFHTLMDKEFLIRIFENDIGIGHLEKFLAGFRIHDQSKSAGNPVSIKWFQEDNEKLLDLYRHSYGQNPKLFSKLIYRSEKLIKGVYAKQFIFSKQWNGRRVNELNANNCAYL